MLKLYNELDTSIHQNQIQQQDQQVVEEVESEEHIDPQRFDDDFEIHFGSDYADRFYTVNNLDGANDVITSVHQLMLKRNLQLLLLKRNLQLLMLKRNLQLMMRIKQ